MQLVSPSGFVSPTMSPSTFLSPTSTSQLLPPSPGGLPHHATEEEPPPPTCWARFKSRLQTIMAIIRGDIADEHLAIIEVRAAVLSASDCCLFIALSLRINFSSAIGEEQTSESVGGVV